MYGGPFLSISQDCPSLDADAWLAREHLWIQPPELTAIRNPYEHKAQASESSGPPNVTWHQGASSRLLRCGTSRT